MLCEGVCNDSANLTTEKEEINLIGKFIEPSRIRACAGHVIHKL